MHNKKFIYIVKKTLKSKNLGTSLLFLSIILINKNLFFYQYNNITLIIFKKQITIFLINLIKNQSNITEK